MVLSKVSFDAVMSRLLRWVDLAIRMAIILLSPRISFELLNPDMLRCRRFDKYVHKLSLRFVYSGHLPSTELHGM